MNYFTAEVYKIGIECVLRRRREINLNGKDATNRTGRR